MAFQDIAELKSETSKASGMDIGDYASITERIDCLWINLSRTSKVQYV